MADVARGLTPVKYLSGAVYSGAANRYSVPATDSTALFLGDAVKLAGSADSNGHATVARAAVGDNILGVVVSVAPETRDSTIHRVASTLRDVYVADDPNLLFEIQSDDDTTALAVTDVGLNANIIVAAGSTVTGWSGTELDSSSAASTANLDLQIVGFVSREDQTVGTQTKCLVRINSHQWANETAGL